MTLFTQIIWLFVLAIPIACIAWTVTHEELFRDFHEYCVSKNKKSKNWFESKFFYLFTCEYCFSHYVTLAFLIITKYKLLIGGFWGYIIAGFALVFVANIYMSLFALIKVDIKLERADLEIKEEKIK